MMACSRRVIGMLRRLGIGLHLAKPNVDVSLYVRELEALKPLSLSVFLFVAQAATAAASTTPQRETPASARQSLCTA